MSGRIGQVLKEAAQKIEKAIGDAGRAVRKHFSDTGSGLRKSAEAHATHETKVEQDLKKAGTHRTEDVKPKGGEGTSPTSATPGPSASPVPDRPAGDMDLDTTPLGSPFHGENSGAPTPVGGNVRYLDESERQAYRVSVQDGKLVDSRGRPFDTSTASTVHSGDAPRAIYVMDHDGNVYASKYQEVGEFHHSSLLAGQPVAGAGELEVVDGQLRTITTKSGHYRPSQAMQDQVLEVLRRQGIDTSQVTQGGFA